MNKKLIQQLLDDDETMTEIANDFGFALDTADDGYLYDDLMRASLNKLNDIPVKGDMIAIEVSDHMWVRGNYLHTNPDGKLVVQAGNWCKKIAGKRVDLVVEGEEGEADV